MSETNKYIPWWDLPGTTTIQIIRQLVQYPKAIALQVLVATDAAHSPNESTQEDFPTLDPKEASKLLKI